MKVVFDRKDFKLCEVPVPVGYPQSQTHCGVAFYNGDYYLTTSPYPVPHYSFFKLYFWAAVKKITRGKINKLYVGENYENPCIYKGVLKPGEDVPTRFELLQGAPLMNKPVDKFGLGSYCSDPDLSIEGSAFHVLNRTSIRKGRSGNPNEDYDTYTHIITGSINEYAFRTDSIKTLFHSQDCSPCLFRNAGLYHYISITTNSYNTGEPCKGVFLRTCSELDGEWSAPVTIELNNGDYEPWHMSVFEYEGRMFAIVACVKHGEMKRCWQMLGEFNENFNALKIYQMPLTDYKSYRGSAIVRKNDGMFILYSTTVHEKIKGSKSVDGRDVIMSSMPFNKMLEILRNS